MKNFSSFVQRYTAHILLPILYLDDGNSKHTVGCQGYWCDKARCDAKGWSDPGYNLAEWPSDHTSEDDAPQSRRSRRTVCGQIARRFIWVRHFA